MERGGEEGIIETWLRKHRLIYIGATRHPFILSIHDGAADLSSFELWLGQDYIFIRAFIPFVATIFLRAWKESDDQSDIEVVLGGMAAVDEEIAWFNKEASNWKRTRFPIGNFSNVITSLRTVLLRSPICLRSCLGVDPHTGHLPKRGSAEQTASLLEGYPDQPEFDLVGRLNVQPNFVKCDRFLECLMHPNVEYAAAMTAFWSIEAVYLEGFATARTIVSELLQNTGGHVRDGAMTTLGSTVTPFKRLPIAVWRRL
ncbi:hypothetical protein Ancab_012997 [Ancistrocladus abbreviatus]